MSGRSGKPTPLSLALGKRAAAHAQGAMSVDMINKTRQVMGLAPATTTRSKEERYHDTIRYYGIPVSHRIPSPQPFEPYYHRPNKPHYNRMGDAIAADPIVVNKPSPNQLVEDMPLTKQVASVDQIADDDHVYFDMTTGVVVAVVAQQDRTATVFYDMYYDPTGTIQTVRRMRGADIKQLASRNTLMITREGKPSRWVLPEEVEPYLRLFHDKDIPLFDVVRKPLSFAPLTRGRPAADYTRLRIVYSRLGRIKS